MNLKAYTLASSSKGNAIYVRAGEDEILIDAGISARRLDSALMELGTSLSRIKGVFVTHEHSDHTAALPMLAKKFHTPIHFTEASAKEYSASGKGTLDSTVLHPPIFKVELGEITVESFVTPHDSACSVGYVVSAYGEKIAVATDLGIVSDSVREALIGIERIILESNHDEGMLLCGSYPYTLKRRILSDRGHLSNELASEFARELAKSGTKRILLAHLSPENNHPELALQTAKCFLAGSSCEVAVAAQLGITEL